MSIRIPIFTDHGRTYHADSCEAVRSAVQNGSVKLSALARGTYPGKRLKRGVCTRGQHLVGAYTGRRTSPERQADGGAPDQIRGDRLLAATLCLKNVLPLQAGRDYSDWVAEGSPVGMYYRGGGSETGRNY